MLEIALAAFYSTLLCWTWGHLTLRFLSAVMPRARTGLPSSIVCLTGLSSLAVTAGALSIWMPLGGIALQTGLLLVAGVYWLLNKKIRIDFFATCRKLAFLHPLSMCLLLCFAVLLLLMGAWIIVHPDTVGYHAQTIQWIAAYKAIPGLVHLHVRYGYQGYWFLASALFSFPFLHTAAPTFINTCVAGWYVVFMIGRIEEYRKIDVHGSILWILLFAYTWWDFGMLRLTAVSTSPDFVAGLYCWVVFYFLLNKKQEADWISIFFFSIMAVLIKLSSVPLLLLAAYALYHLFKKHNLKAGFLLTGFAVLAIGAFLARNIITSGHFIFPSPLLDVLQVDWKLDHQSTRFAQQYISDYARIGEKARYGVPLGLTWKEWMPVWWMNKSGAEKFLILSLLACILLCGVFFKKIIQSSSLPTRLFFLLSAAGLLFWFVQAPDPRFGYGFIFPLQGVVLYRLGTACPFAVQVGKRFTSLILGTFTVIVVAYTVYRFTHFFHSRNLLEPEGIPPVATRQFKQGGIVFRMPCHVCGCGSTPLPCAYDDDPFTLRGASLEDGFRRAQPLKSDH
ncbi:MAG: hypothetical protein INR73_18320 [Williamsia sp.]|nr:hypothetical protein [Williamsia sp.]